MRTIKIKLGKMRKPQEFIVCPRSSNTDNNIVIQSDKSTGMFDPKTGKGVLNIKGCYFAHLNPILGAKPFVFPPEFVKWCIDNQPKSGDLIGGAVYVA